MLLELSGITSKVDEQTIGFYIAPKLNSIGRMSSAKLGLSFLRVQYSEKICYRRYSEGYYFKNRK